MVEWPLPPDIVLGVRQLATPLHARHAWRLLPLLRGLLFARGRRTAAAWPRAAGLGRDYQRYYYFLGALGRRAGFVASLLLRRVADVVAPGERTLLGLDDAPTQRHGPRAEGAGTRHNPSPGPAGHKFLYRHVWVTIAWPACHPRWGTIGLPLRALLYVRKKDVGRLAARYGVGFRTKLVMAAELVTGAADWLRYPGKALWVVADGAYAKRPFLKAARAAGAVVVSRLRKDAALSSVPAPPRPGAPKRRGRKPTCGQQAISLARRAGQRRGRQSEEVVLYRGAVTKTYKTFLATYRPAGGLTRVVLVREGDGWAAFFCTGPRATAAQALGAVAERAAVEQGYHDLKGVHGAGQQQLRHYWASVAAFRLSLWAHTPVELWAWRRSAGRLRDRTGSPWDDPGRRPSHAGRCNALKREGLRQELRRVGRRRPLTRNIRALFRGLLKLIA
jgi:DDE superfamily endonuclease